MTTQTIDQSVNPGVNPAEETIRVGPLTVRFLLTGENSAGAIAAFEVVVPGAQRLMAPAHSHDHYEETIYGVEGVLTWTVDGKADRRRAGTGALHSARRRSPVRQQRPARTRRCSALITPAAIGPQYFREAAEVINTAAGGPPDKAKMVEVMRRHGLTPCSPTKETHL